MVRIELLSEVRLNPSVVEMEVFSSDSRCLRAVCSMFNYLYHRLSTVASPAGCCIPNSIAHAKHSRGRTSSPYSINKLASVGTSLCSFLQSLASSCRLSTFFSHFTSFVPPSATFVNTQAILIVFGWVYFNLSDWKYSSGRNSYRLR